MIRRLVLSFLALVALVLLLGNVCQARKVLGYAGTADEADNHVRSHGAEPNSTGIRSSTPGA